MTTFQVAQVSTPDIKIKAVVRAVLAEGSVTNIQSSVIARPADPIQTSSGTYATVADMSVDIAATGSPILILATLASVMLQQNQAGAGSFVVTGTIRLTRQIGGGAATELLAQEIVHTLGDANDIGGQVSFPVTIMYLDVGLVSEIYTYKLQWKVTGGGSSSVALTSADARVMQVMEIFK